MTEPTAAAYDASPTPGNAGQRGSYEAVRIPSLPLDERLALALVEDCGTALDETDVAYVVAAVLPVAHRYGARNQPDENGEDRFRQRIAAALNLADRVDPTCGAERMRAFVADLTRILRGEAE